MVAQKLEILPETAFDPPDKDVPNTNAANVVAFLISDDAAAVTGVGIKLSLGTIGA